VCPGGSVEYNRKPSAYAPIDACSGPAYCAACYAPFQNARITVSLRFFRRRAVRVEPGKRE
jgi:hypothetical protein